MEETQQRSWFGRNWIWAVPAGGCLGVTLLSVLFVVGIVVLVFGMMKSSEPYEHAVAAAKASPAVQEVLGTPIEVGMFVSGEISTSGAFGNAKLAIPISGPKDTGTIYVAGEKTAGKWSYSLLIVEFDQAEGGVDLQ